MNIVVIFMKLHMYLVLLLMSLDINFFDRERHAVDVQQVGREF